MKLSFKAKRNIGLIVLTLVVVVAVFLIIFFVSKAEEDAKIKNAHIGEQLETKELTFVVKDMKIQDSFEDIVATEGKCLMILNVNATGKKGFQIKKEHFTIKNGEQKYCDSQEYYMLDVIYIKSGQSLDFYLVYEVPKNQIDSFYLTAYNYRIDVGGSMVDVWG